ncbi:MAG TPA: HAD-IB family hydrolase [Candidatus Acidoferrales bacterium]|nr:HAD-IB family hydrolase [Candidatus Acidoferrales bacterium]
MSSAEKIGAFFDLDGTLVAPPSLEWRFIGFLLSRDALGTVDIARWLGQFAKKILPDPRGATLGNKHYLAGLRESLAEDWERWLDSNAPPFYPEAIRRMTWHWSRGHRVFLVSGTLDFLAWSVAARLPGPVEVRATRLEANAGYWTGRLAGEHMSGEAKARVVRDLAARFCLSLWDSYAYGNSISDLPMLDSVGRRVAVNPPTRLARIARGEGWPSCDWRESAAGVRLPRQLTAREAR